MLKKLFGSKNVLELKAPINGKVVPLSEVPDEVFSKELVGEGFAIIPNSGEVCAPGDGKIIQIFPTKHAIGYLIKNVEILIHFGLDTVELKGEGFTKFADVNNELNSGDKIIDVDLSVLADNNKHTITPIIFTNKSQYKSLKVEYKEVKIGDVCATLTLV